MFKSNFVFSETEVPGNPGSPGGPFRPCAPSRGVGSPLLPVEIQWLPFYTSILSIHKSKAGHFFKIRKVINRYKQLQKGLREHKMKIALAHANYDSALWLHFFLIWFEKNSISKRMDLYMVLMEFFKFYEIWQEFIF